MATSRPIYDFEGIVQPLVPKLETFATVNLIHVLVNAVLLLFWGNSRRRLPHLTGLLLGIGGVVVSIAAAACIAAAAMEWNGINSSDNSFFTLHRSVFVGNIGQMQDHFRLQFLLACCLFLPVSVYLACFWGRLLQLATKGIAIVPEGVNIEQMNQMEEGGGMEEGRI